MTFSVLFPKKQPMKSLKLKLDDLRVETFETSAAMGERGTVAGMELSEICQSEPTNPNRVTCAGNTCIGSGCTNCGDPYNSFGCPGGGGSLAYTQCEPETCDPFICGPY